MSGLSELDEILGLFEKKEPTQQEQKPVLETPVPPKVETAPETLPSEKKTEIALEPQKKEVEEKAVFELTEDGIPSKEVYLIYGNKGVGKTVTALSFPGKILALSFDRKTAIIKANMFKNDDRIKIYNAVKYMDYSNPEALTKSANDTYQYILFILEEHVKHYGNPDWVLIDGSDIFHQICEWTMRYRHNIEPFAGISNLNVWKERRLLIRNIHYKALDIANKGVIYTTYTEKDSIVVDGELITQKDVPRWIDVLMFETDYVLYCYVIEGQRKFAVRVVTSKNDSKLRTGMVYDVTDRTLWEVVKR
ncbi:MAG: AAA family ATPase [Candidatus Nanoarchaeia archaeon]|nr:AAA family ATPase [Candidatus Jingweiarchaeum tengchongense]